MNCKVGDRVADKFKKPRVGDESNRGTVTRVDKHTKIVAIKMDTGFPQVTEIPFGQFDAIFDVLDPEDLIRESYEE